MILRKTIMKNKHKPGLKAHPQVWNPAKVNNEDINMHL